MKKWKLLSSRMAFDNKWFKVRQDKAELPNGKIIDDYFLWPRGDVAMVVPVTKEGKFILVKQYKHAASDVVLEFPAGMQEENEDPEESARRELLEETGYSTEKLQKLGRFMSDPSKTIGYINIFLAKNASKTNIQNLDENENIEIIELEPTRLQQLIFNGEIYCSETIVAATFAFKELGLKFM